MCAISVITTIRTDTQAFNFFILANIHQSTKSLNQNRKKTLIKILKLFYGTLICVLPH